MNESTLAGLRLELGEEQVATAWDVGPRLTPDQAVEPALAYLEG